MRVDVGRYEFELVRNDLASILTTGNNAHGKSVFQFMGLVIGIFSIELLLSNEMAKKYCRIALVLGKVMRLHEDYRK